jgi:hypothetical protein
MTTTAATQYVALTNLNPSNSRPPSTTRSISAEQNLILSLCIFCDQHQLRGSSRQPTSNSIRPDGDSSNSSRGMMNAEIWFGWVWSAVPPPFNAPVFTVFGTSNGVALAL